MTEHSSPATGYFGDHVAQFAAQYQHKACFRDRLALFTAEVRTATPPPARLLDFGCGPGVISLALGELGYDVLALDGAIGMVEAARATQQKLALPNVRFEHSLAEGVVLPAEQFDGVVCSSVVEYVEDDFRLIATLIDALKPGGHLFISVPQTPSLGGIAEDMVRWFRDLRKRSNSRRLYLRRYNRRRFVKKLGNLGLGTFRCISFELPVLKEWGIPLSRCKWLGVMLLVVGQKRA